MGCVRSAHFQYPATDRPPCNVYVMGNTRCYCTFQYPATDRPPCNWRHGDGLSSLEIRTFSILLRIDPPATHSSAAVTCDVLTLSVSCDGSTPLQLHWTVSQLCKYDSFSILLRIDPPATTPLASDHTLGNAFSILLRIDPPATQIQSARQRSVRVLSVSCDGSTPLQLARWETYLMIS